MLEHIKRTIHHLSHPHHHAEDAPNASKAASPPRSGPNVIVFGETGAGKSSVINMLEGDKQAVVGHSASGVTFQNHRYMKEIGNHSFNVYDTVGLSEGACGTVSPEHAIKALYSLLRGLQNGVHLLVFVWRGPRLTATAMRNYDMFYKTFCQRKVRIVLVATGLEEEDDMDSWWDNNKTLFHKSNMHFDGVACITSSQGKKQSNGYAYQQEYATSKGKVQQLIAHKCESDPWTMPVNDWFTAILRDICIAFAKYFSLRPNFAHKTLCQALQRYAEFKPAEAARIAFELDELLRRADSAGVDTKTDWDKASVDWEQGGWKRSLSLKSARRRSSVPRFSKLNQAD